jgi:DNA-binding CsgD family transcriptional regulator
VHIDEIPELPPIQGFHLGATADACDDCHMRLRALLAALGAALGGWAIALAVWKPGEEALPVPVHLAIGWSFVAAGLVAWARRPENRTGLLMTLTGIVWFGRDFDSLGFSPATRLSELSQNLFLALLAHQVVVFPDGVPGSRRERVLVAAIYTLAVPGYAVSEIGPTVNDVLSGLGIVLAVAAVAILVDRWRRASVPRRRALEPLLWAGPPALTVVAASIAKDYLDLSVSATGDTVLDWCSLAYTLIPAAFLAGVLRTRLHRGALAELVLELSDATPAQARDALARSLGDPSLELAFWIPERNRYVDSGGKPFDLPQDRAVTELNGVAALVYDPSLLEDPELVRAAGAAARLSLENARLQAKLHSAVDEPATAPEALAELTSRELEVLALIAEGRTDRGIAQALYVSPKTVEAHVRSIFRKLGLPSDTTENRRVHAVLAFLRARPL